MLLPFLANATRAGGTQWLREEFRSVVGAAPGRTFTALPGPLRVPLRGAVSTRGARVTAAQKGRGKRAPAMAASRLPPSALSLKQFMRRQQVLQLYRKILKAIRQVPNEADHRYLRDWAREDFRRNKDATDEDAIKMMITQGNLQLQELERTLKLAKS